MEELNNKNSGGNANEDKRQRGKVCRGDCYECSFQQRVYCSAQITRNMLDVITEMNDKVGLLDLRVSELSERFESIQPEKDEELIKPFVQEEAEEPTEETEEV